MTRGEPRLLLLATTNADKIREIRHLLRDVPISLVSLAALPRVAEPEETGVTFAENARLKARYYDACLAPLAADVTNGDATGAGATDAPAMRVLTVAEDSGLEVDGLDGAPGVHSARFLRPDATYPERFAEIYRRLAARPEAPRTARFQCAIAVVDAGRVCFETTGAVEGRIADQPRGTKGFGYDPIFWYPPLSATLAETREADKLAVAHRGHAFRNLARWLAETEPPTC